MMGIVETTPIVAEELKRHLPFPPNAGWPAWLHIVKPSPASKATAQGWRQAGLLDRGEAEALAVAHETKADGFLTDDAEAREMAGALRIDARGSLGVVLMTAARGQINQAEASAFLARLESHSTLWLSKRVRRAAHDALKQIYHT